MQNRELQIKHKRKKIKCRFCADSESGNNLLLTVSLPNTQERKMRKVGLVCQCLSVLDPVQFLILFNGMLFFFFKLLHTAKTFTISQHFQEAAETRYPTLCNFLQEIHSLCFGRIQTAHPFGTFSPAGLESMAFHHIWLLFNWFALNCFFCHQNHFLFS